MIGNAAKLWWIDHKDLLSEWRARRVWPAMLLFGTVVALVFGLQLDLLPEQKTQLVGGLLWLAILFAALLVLDRSFAAEREEGCWEGLLHYPLSPSTIYLAKLLVNVLALATLECALIPLFTLFSGVSLWQHPAAMLAVATLGNVGIAALGTLLAAATAGVREGGSRSTLVLLPLVIPVILAAAEATRLLAQNDLGSQCWRWIQLLAGCAVLFVTAGVVLFDFLIED